MVVSEDYSCKPFLIGGMFEYTKLNSEGISCGTMKLLPENDFFVIY
jgi:hypothetical protein